MGGLVDLTTTSAGGSGSSATVLLAGLLIAFVVLGLAWFGARRTSIHR